MTARCAQYMSALKIVCKHKISRRLHKNRQITILSLFGNKLIFEVFDPTNVITAPNSDVNVTDGQIDRHCGITTR